MGESPGGTCWADTSTRGYETSSSWLQSVMGRLTIPSLAKHATNASRSEPHHGNCALLIFIDVDGWTEYPIFIFLYLVFLFPVCCRNFPISTCLAFTLWWGPVKAKDCGYDQWLEWQALNLYDITDEVSVDEAAWGWFVFVCCLIRSSPLVSRDAILWNIGQLWMSQVISHSISISIKSEHVHALLPG
jgi:hypothetical protein